jgi:homoserine/homoserine lactone efflux protein
MSFDTWLAYLITELIITITPGPAIILVSAQGFKYGFGNSVSATMGIITCNVIYFTLAALGLGTLILSMDNVFTGMKIIGVIYLAWCGLQAIRHSFKDVVFKNNENEYKSTSLKSYLQAFFIQAVNPKALIFFVVLLPQFVNTKENIPIQFTILGLTNIIPETIVLMTYGWFSAKGSKRFKENIRFNRWKERVVGLLLIGIAIYIFLLK